MGGQDQVDHATLTSSIDSLRILIGEDRVLGNDYRISLASILADLRESVEKLDDDFRYNTELPNQITTEAASLLDISGHALASICQHVNSQTSTEVLNDDADASRLKTVAKRLKIASDMHTLSTSHFLETESNNQETAAAKSEILISIAHMRGFFRPIPGRTSQNAARSDFLPSYEAAMESHTPEVTPTQKSSVTSTSTGYVDEKAAFRGLAMRNFTVPAPARPTTIKKSNATDTSRPYISTFRPNLEVKPVSTIDTKLPEASSVLKVQFFGNNYEMKVALATENSLQVYSANKGILIWEKTSHSPELEAHSIFTIGMSVSPDSSIISMTVKQGDDRRLFLFDANTGNVKSSHPLAQNDSDLSIISPDNKKLALMQWGGSSNAVNFLKIHRLDDTPIPPKQILVKQLQRWRGLGAEYAPDSRHVVVIEGPSAVEVDSSNLSIFIRLYDCVAGCLATSYEWPGPASQGFMQTLPPFKASLLILRDDQWLCSIPDYHSSDKSLIVDIKTGETVTSVMADRSFSQTWNAGFVASMFVSMCVDQATGVVTRTETNESLLSRGKTVTLTRFTLAGAQNREKAMREMSSEKWSRVRVVKLGSKDQCYLSKDGMNLLIHRHGSNKFDVMALVL